MRLIGKDRMNCRPNPPRGSCDPTERKFANLHLIIDDYIRSRRKCAKKELAAFRNHRRLSNCISQAGLARTQDGKRLHHQRRIPRQTLRAWASALLRKERLIRSCRSFKELFEVLDNQSRKFWRNGELTVYDTALRIGAYLRREPTEVFLHRGTRKGAKALGFDSKRRSIRPRELPKEFRLLKPREIEDCLCIYRSELTRFRGQDTNP